MINAARYAFLPRQQDRDARQLNRQMHAFRFYPFNARASPEQGCRSGPVVLEFGGQGINVGAGACSARAFLFYNTLIKNLLHAVSG